jgi:hypothetical protein
MALFQLGKFKLHSGATSRFKIECDSLSDEDLECLAHLLSERLPSFGSVEGVPRGGLRLADKMRKYVTSGPLLIVDDVLTKGTSMNEHRAGREAIGAVLFARAQSIPDWITPLFQISPILI